MDTKVTVAAIETGEPLADRDPCDDAQRDPDREVAQTETETETGRAELREYPNGYWTKHEYDAAGNMVYWENSNGWWEKMEYDASGNKIYYEGSETGFLRKNEFDASGNKIYSETSNGRWVKHAYDASGNKIYSEFSNGCCNRIYFETLKKVIVDV